MSRATFSAGLYDHQAEVAVWARRRLVDRGGQWFETGRSRIPQYGVVAADGVGLGKTWEALAASALILVEQGKETKGGRNRRNVRRQPARVLVLCPPGLVSKWSREIRDPEGFSKQLVAWAGVKRRREFVLRTLTTPYEIRRHSHLPPTNKARDALVLPPGTYVCNWNVLRRSIGSGRSRLAAFRAQKWDVVIVDEAHHREAREAIAAIRYWAPRLLLTATPFQLEPRELHGLLHGVLDARHGEHKVLARPPVRPFVAALRTFFEGGKAPGRREKREAEAILRQVIARSDALSRGRSYFLIGKDGRATRILTPERLREPDLHGLLHQFVEPDPQFEEWYFRLRLRLADGAPTFLPTKLRQALSTPKQAARAVGKPPRSAPRVDSLAAWARTQFKHDLLRAARDGMPRKTVVFTSFVGAAAKELCEVLTKALADAWQSARMRAEWRRMAAASSRGIRSVLRQIRHHIDNHAVRAMSEELKKVVDALAKLDVAGDGPVRDLFGHGTFRRLVVADLKRRLDALALVLQGDHDEGWWARLHRQERCGLQAAVRALGNAALVGTYTGHDDRRERDATGEAFRTPLAPWVLVASNVGSEGIDLHTFSAHLVHFDIEWNPARMEQREGRTDRLGRVLKEPVNVYFLLVRGTYDERMLHQLVARQRWHSVLLGRPGARLARDQDGRIDAPWIEVESARKLTLDLRPRQSQRRI